MAAVIGVITARGGSRGIPNKNLRELGGVPLVTWISKAAAKAHLDQVILTTDSPAIARHAAFGRLVWRPEALAADDTPDLPVFEHVLREVSVPDEAILVHLRPTAPFVRPEDIDDVVQRLASSRCDSIRSVIPARHHPRKVYYEDYSGALTLRPATLHHAANSPRQSLEIAWAACGYVDAVRTSALRGLIHMEGTMILRWVAPVDRAVDLDTEREWAAAEAMILTRGWRPTA